MSDHLLALPLELQSRETVGHTREAIILWDHQQCHLIQEEWVVVMVVAVVTLVSAISPGKETTKLWEIYDGTNIYFFRITLKRKLSH